MELELMELKDTVGLMLSDDYNDRFRAEYWQLRIRAKKLIEILFEYFKGKEKSNISKESYELLNTEYTLIVDYYKLLEKRAKIEGIKL